MLICKAITEDYRLKKEANVIIKSYTKPVTEFTRYAPNSKVFGKY